MSMDSGLSESDMARIAAFARTPVHKRTPDMLVPDEDANEDGRAHELRGRGRPPRGK